MTGNSVSSQVFVSDTERVMLDENAQTVCEYFAATLAKLLVSGQEDAYKQRLRVIQERFCLENDMVCFVSF